MSDGNGLEDFSLIELFRGEVETHSETLNTALLALERAPDDTSRINEMMRAAHSIKGAARIVDVDPAVNVAHVMEDCFVAAQKGILRLTPADVDVLLRGVDLLGKISAATCDPQTDLNQLFSSPVQESVRDLQSVLAGTNNVPSPDVLSSFPTADSALAVGSTSTSGSLPDQDSKVQVADEATVCLPAILDSVAAENVRLQIMKAIEKKAAMISLDLTQTRDLDVFGLGLLAAIPAYLAFKTRINLRLVGVTPEMGTVLRVTGLAESYGLRLDALKETK